jgi:adenylate kinase family enzyme
MLIFLIVKRFLVLGPDGEQRRKYCEVLKKKYGMVSIEVGNLLKLEVQKKTELGQKIEPLLKKRQNSKFF